MYLSQSTDIKVVVTIDKYISKIAYTSTCTSAKTLGTCTNICTDIARAVCNDSAFMSTEISLLLFIDILRHQKAASDRIFCVIRKQPCHQVVAQLWLPSCNVRVKRLNQLMFLMINAQKPFTKPMFFHHKCKEALSKNCVSDHKSKEALNKSCVFHHKCREALNKIGGGP